MKDPKDIQEDLTVQAEVIELGRFTGHWTELDDKSLDELSAEQRRCLKRLQRFDELEAAVHRSLRLGDGDQARQQITNLWVACGYALPDGYDEQAWRASEQYKMLTRQIAWCQEHDWDILIPYAMLFAYAVEGWFARGHRIVYSAAIEARAIRLMEAGLPEAEVIKKALSWRPVSSTPRKYPWENADERAHQERYERDLRYVLERPGIYDVKKREAALAVRKAAKATSRRKSIIHEDIGTKLMAELIKKDTVMVALYCCVDVDSEKWLAREAARGRELSAPPHVNLVGILTLGEYQRHEDEKGREYNSVTFMFACEAIHFERAYTAQQYPEDRRARAVWGEELCNGQDTQSGTVALVIGQWVREAQARGVALLEAGRISAQQDDKPQIKL